MIRTQAGSRVRRWPASLGAQKAAAFLLVAWAIGLSSGMGQEELPDNTWGTEAAREALSKQGFPWYDEVADDLHSLDVDPVVPPPEAHNWKLRLPDWDDKAPNWNWNLDLFWQIVQWTIWGLLISLLVGTLVYIIRTVIRDGGFSLGGGRPSNVEQIARETEQIENLPFPVEHPKSDLLAEARYHYENSDYGKAIIYLFSYQLVHLDKHHLIRLAKGKTNRQYLRELGVAGGTIRAILQQTTVAFEDVFFGNHPLNRQDFEDCWQHLDEFHRGVQRLDPMAVN